MWNVTNNNKICEICGKEFIPSGRAQKYCGEECSSQGRILKNMEYKIYLQKKYKVVCKFCGKEIAPFFREGIHRGKMHDLCRMKYLANKKLNKIRYTAGDRTMMCYHGISIDDIKDYIKNPQEWEI